MTALFRRGVLGAALGLSAVALCLQAQAQDSGTSQGTAAPSDTKRAAEAPEQTARRQAQKLFRRALEAYRSRRYIAAIDDLLEAHRLFPRPAFLYNLALVYEALGDPASTLRWLRDYREQADDTATLAEVDAKIRVQEQKLADKGLQQVRVASDPPGAVVEVDYRRLGLTPHTFEAVPGSHRIRLELSGYQAIEAEFVLRAERSLALAYELVEHRPAASSRAPLRTQEQAGAVSGGAQAAPSADAVRATGRPVRSWTWMALGAGAAGFGGAVAFELLRRAKEGAAERAAQRDFQDQYDEMRRAQTIARMFVGLGATFAVAGGLSLYFDLRREASRSAQAGVSGCGASMCAGVRGQF